MVFEKKYPDGYHGTVNALNLRLFGHLMDKKTRRELAFRVGKKHRPLHYVTVEQVETDDLVYLLDLSTLSCVTLEAKKNRFLQNTKGYYQYSFLGAKNILSNRKYAMFVKGSQITTKDLLTFKKLIERDLGQRIQFVTDNRHEHSLIAKKDVTMSIEVEFGGLKTKLYRMLKPLQKTGKKGRIYTKLSFNSLVRLYLRRMVQCGFKVLDPARINKLAEQQIITSDTYNKIQQSVYRSK